MTTIKERMTDDLKTAMKAGDTARRDALRMLQAAIKQVEIDSGTPVSDEKAIDILMGEVKRRRDTITELTGAGREVANEESEIRLIENYLPSQLSREELEAEVLAAIRESGATTAKDMGNVMKVLLPRVKGRAEGKAVNDMVRTLLSEPR